MRPVSFVGSIRYSKSVPASLGDCWERLGTVLIVLERFVSIWNYLGTVWSVSGAFGCVWERFGSVCTRLGTVGSVL